jgi:hypothetical protein
MSVKSLSTAEIRRELERRERGAAKVVARRDVLAKQLAALDAELADLGVDGAPRRRGRPPGSRNKPSGRKPGRKPGRKSGRKPGRPAGPKLPKNKRSLGDALAAAVRPGSVVSPVEAAKRVKAAGYKSNSGSFNVVVAMRLRDHAGFKHVGRGQYRRVGGKAATTAQSKAATKRKPRPTVRRGKPKGRTGRKAAGRPRAKPAAAAAVPTAA